MSGTEVLSNFSNNEKRSIGQRNARHTSILGVQEKRSTGTDNTANVLIVDISGSTIDKIGRGDSRSKLVGIKEAVCQFIGNSSSFSTIAIIVFETMAKVIVPMQQIGQNKLKFIQAVQRLSPGSATDMKGALQLTLKEFRGIPSDIVKRAYLLTDGMSNTDPTAEGNKAKGYNVQLNTIGFGDSFNIDEGLLTKIASTSASGTPLYYHFTDAKKMTGFFKKQTQTITQ
jgi:Mg-chelatase subunit ChlD